MGPNAVAFILSGLQALPGLIAAGSNVVTEVQALSGQIKTLQSENRDPTPEEWQAQNAALAGGVAALLATHPGV